LSSAVVHLIRSEQPDDEPFRGVVPRSRENRLDLNIPRLSQYFDKRNIVCIIRQRLNKYHSYHTAIDLF